MKRLPRIARFAIAGTLGVLLWSIYLVLRIWIAAEGGMPQSKTDAVVVLGAAVHRGQPSAVFKARLDTGIRQLTANGRGVLILTGGVGAGDMKAESEVGRDYAVSCGVPASACLIELVSHTTRENLKEAQRLMQQHGLSTCVVVTDPLHVYRSQRMAEDLGMSATLVGASPSAFKTWKTKLPMLFRELYFYNHYLLFGE